MEALISRKPFCPSMEVIATLLPSSKTSFKGSPFFVTSLLKPRIPGKGPPPLPPIEPVYDEPLHLSGLKSQDLSQPRREDDPMLIAYLGTSLSEMPSASATPLPYAGSAFRQLPM